MCWLALGSLASIHPCLQLPPDPWEEVLFFFCIFDPATFEQKLVDSLPLHEPMAGERPFCLDSREDAPSQLQIVYRCLLFLFLLIDCIAAPRMGTMVPKTQLLHYVAVQLLDPCSGVVLDLYNVRLH